jgi:16S rRNA pseudouridine516 synthase
MKEKAVKLRLDKALAHIGIGSRKEVKQLVRSGGVLVNGTPVTKSDMIIDAAVDAIVVNGESVRYREFIYLLMNKPQGVLSATEDRNDKVIIDLLEPEYAAFEPFPVGRLDKDTEGLLLLTNDGQLTHRLLSPKKHVPKTYFARVAGEVTEEDGKQFAAGVELDDGYKTLPAQLEILSAGLESEIRLTIYEGKFHQVKRMFAAVGKSVTYLQRIRMGNLELDPALALGEYRELSEAELAGLQNFKARQEN